MIEIQNIEAVNKGNIIAKCDVYIKPWHMILREITVFQKGENRWITMPARQYESQGEKKYIELVQFDSEAVRKRFRNQIMSAIDQYLEKNPDMQPEPVIVESDNLPF